MEFIRDALFPINTKKKEFVTLDEVISDTVNLIFELYEFIRTDEMENHFQLLKKNSREALLKAVALFKVGKLYEIPEGLIPYFSLLEKTDEERTILIIILQLINGEVVNTPKIFNNRINHIVKNYGCPENFIPIIASVALKGLVRHDLIDNLFNYAVEMIPIIEYVFLASIYGCNHGFFIGKQSVYKITQLVLEKKASIYWAKAKMQLNISNCFTVTERVREIMDNVFVNNVDIKFKTGEDGLFIIGSEQLVEYYLRRFIREISVNKRLLTSFTQIDCLNGVRFI